MTLFEQFSYGKLTHPGGQRDIDGVEWSKHPVFNGVELKHIITAQDTEGSFSYHLVRIAPGKKIGSHIHETQLETHEVIEGGGICACEGETWSYEPGAIAIIPARAKHEVTAGDNGLYLFAKFVPALC